MSKANPLILIVEDSENILDLLELMVELQGWKSSSLKNIDHFMEAVEEVRPDVILMDMLLSGANGCDACRAVKNSDSHKHTPVVMMSAHPEAAIETREAGADYFIDKPFDMEQMISLLETCLSENTEQK
jgi:DNA-binding response OmpR family regulator